MHVRARNEHAVHLPALSEAFCEDGLESSSLRCAHDLPDADRAHLAEELTRGARNAAAEYQLDALVQGDILCMLSCEHTTHRCTQTHYTCCTEHEWRAQAWEREQTQANARTFHVDSLDVLEHAVHVRGLAVVGHVEWSVAILRVVVLLQVQQLLRAVLVPHDDVVLLPVRLVARCKPAALRRIARVPVLEQVEDGVVLIVRQPALDGQLLVVLLPGCLPLLVGDGRRLHVSAVSSRWWRARGGGGEPEREMAGASDDTGEGRRGGEAGCQLNAKGKYPHVIIYMVKYTKAGGTPREDGGRWAARTAGSTSARK